MDELEFRRRVYANPDALASDVIEAANHDYAKQKFWQETRALNQKVKQALDIPVPSDLADKLIWQTTMLEHQRQKTRARWQIAMAASVAFVIGSSFALWSPTQVDLGSAALAHMDYTQTEGLAATPVSLTQINAKLGPMGAVLGESIGEVYVANYCQLDEVRSLHLVMQTEQGPVSVFFTPFDKKNHVPERFSNDGYLGTGFSTSNANVMIVGDKRTDLNSVSQKVKRSINRA